MYKKSEIPGNGLKNFLPYDVGPARVFLGEAEKTMCGLGPASRGEYSCRCHGKRVISAPSKPLKLKLAGRTFYRVKLDCVPKDFVRRRFVLAIFAIRSEMAYSRFSAINFISPQRSNAEQNPLVRTFIIPQTIPLPSYSFNRLNCTSKSSI